MIIEQETIIKKNVKIQESKNPNVFFASGIFRISDIKMNRVAKLVRNYSKKNLEEVFNMLKLFNQKASKILQKVIFSAYSNCKNTKPDQEINMKDLNIFLIHVGKGYVMKRMFPRARGQADQIHKKTCFVKVYLQLRSDSNGI